MPFSFRCLLGHSWDGCVCRRCNPDGGSSSRGWRDRAHDRAHDRDGCFCRRCRQVVHDWDGCVCLLCEATRDQEHNLRAGACATCGARVTGVREAVCLNCRGEGIVKTDPSSPELWRPCSCDRGVVRENVFSPPVEPCLRPRYRNEGRFAAVRKDANVAALARSIRETGDWSGFVPLRDALQEAGCTDEELLNHCRRAEHTRDCWVLKVLLGLTDPSRDATGLSPDSPLEVTS
jgi:hypothetical protein